MRDEISATQSLYLMRRQRHAFLNHLQVISGWLQLGRPERASQYLEMVAARMNSEAESIRQAPALLGLLMLELGLEAETRGARLEWRVTGPDVTLSAGQLDQLQQQVLEAMAGGGLVTVELAPAGFSVHTPSGKGEG